MAAPEFWVMKVREVLAKGARVEDLHPKIREAIASGALAVVDLDTGRAICEPIAECSSPETATAKALDCAARTGVQHTVVMNADLDLA